jgi:hypothetical protein
VPINTVIATLTKMNPLVIVLTKAANITAKDCGVISLLLLISLPFAGNTKIFAMA